MSEPFSVQDLSGWGRLSTVPCHVYRPEKRRALQTILTDAPHTLLARGLGRSYGDQAVNTNGGIVLFERLNRMTAFDPTTGLLECEAGVSLAEIIRTFLPRGFFLPVVPGTAYITVGGAIANDIHGKNHHIHGAFSSCVESLELLTPDGGRLHCSRNEHADVFWATVGGCGLTGMILCATLRLQRVESAWIDVSYYRCRDLDEVFSRMAEHDEHYTYSVAWVDAVGRGKNLGRSVLMLGRHAPASSLPAHMASDPYRIPRRRRPAVPMNMPEFLLSRPSLCIFNSLYYYAHPTADRRVPIPTYFFPLDAIGHWNRLYGKRGFIQYQFVVPKEAYGIIRSTLELVSKEARGSFLAVLKAMGPAGGGMLSFPKPGYTLAMDLPNGNGLHEFLRKLDSLVVRNGGRIYLAKDITCTAEALREMYPRLSEFQAVCARLDPNRRLQSDLSRRLRLREETL
jgi:FAD/FMN-containing dehydrogenase